MSALDHPGFTAEPSALLDAAARAATAARGHDAVVLLSEAVHRFEEDGRSHSWNRLVVTVTSQAGAQDWTSWWCSWRPWREERPVLRARVITLDGRVHEVDPRTIEEGAAGGADSDMYSDGRRLRAPLPAVSPGAVIEQQCEHREKRPAIDGVVQGLFLFGLAAPSERTRLVLDAPRTLPVRHVARLLPSLVTTRDEIDGRVRTTFSAGRMGPTSDGEPLTPPDVVPRPYVAWSVVGSWAEVSRHYARLVDDKLAGPGAAELANLARAATLGRTGRAAVIDALVDKVRREVRYVGVELGDGAIVPRAPLEVLGRRFGDCKDQATLLVGLLRAVGIDANVALLRNGTGLDVERDLPDLGSFNHAIVHVPAAAGAAAGALAPGPMWIDTTDRFARPGLLPASDQGRWALIAGGDGHLVQTPVLGSRDNADVEEREIILRESGRARVVEVSTLAGSFESSLRSRAAVGDDAKLRDSLAGYVQKEYAADRLDRHQLGDPYDFSQPMRMRLEASEARCGVTGGEPASGVEGAEVAIAEARIATPYLPAALRDPPPGEDGKGTPDVAAPGRVADVYLPEPFSVEWRYRVVPPPGFEPQALPAAERRLFGPAVFTRELRTGADGVVEVNFRFDTGSRRRLSPDEARGLRDGVVAMRRAGDLILRFRQRGESALGAGRLAEALDEFRRLSALHPTEALHHHQVARALLRAGLGAAARLEARRGVELEPRSAAAHKALALVLEHDLFGRQYHRGFDRAGAEAALRRARELDPSDPLVRVELAMLLGFDDDGLRYGPRARLDDAVREYRSLESDLKEQRFRSNVLFPLFHAGRLDELKREARAQERGEVRNALLVAAIAASDGTAPAIDEAGRLESDAARRRSLLAQAGEKLVVLRRYPEAATLVERAVEGATDGNGEGSPLAARARFFRRVQRVDKNPVGRDDPSWPVRELFLRLTAPRLAGAGPGAGVEGLFAVPDAAGAVGGGPRAFQGVFRRAFSGLPDEAVADLVVGSLDFLATGDKAVGYRVVASAPGGNPLRIYVAPAPRGAPSSYQVLGDADTLWPLGRRAIELARRGGPGDLDAARRWLDWAREELRGGDDDPIAVRPFTLLWSRGQSGDAAAIERAAAALLVDEASTAAEAREVLAAARDKAPAEQRHRFDLALLHAAAAARRPDEVLAIADRLAAREPDSEALFSLRCAALRQLGRTADLEALANDRAARFKDDHAALRALADVAALRRDFVRVARLYRRILDGGAAGASDYNQAAWSALFVEPLDAGAVDLARQAVERDGRRRPESLHTLATAQAESGRAGEAVRTLLESLEVARLDEPRPHDLYVLGRVAEQLGIKDAAIDAYRQAARSPDRDDPLSAALLAERRLAALGSPVPGVPVPHAPPPPAAPPARKPR